MSIKEDIKETYKRFDEIFIEKLGKSLEELQMSQIRNQFKEWIETNDPLFPDVTNAEDNFLYIYHFRELQEINRVGIMLKEMADQAAYRKFIQEFFDDNSPSGLQDLKVHQLNNESDKVWHSRDSKVDSLIAEWREQRFSPYL